MSRLGLQILLLLANEWRGDRLAAWGGGTEVLKNGSSWSFQRCGSMFALFSLHSCLFPTRVAPGGDTNVSSSFSSSWSGLLQPPPGAQEVCYRLRSPSPQLQQPHLKNYLRRWTTLKHWQALLSKVGDYYSSDGREVETGEG